MTQSAVDPWLLERLVCPRDHGRLIVRDDALQCEQDHRYPIVDGVPVMLVDDAPPTFEQATAALGRADLGTGDARARHLHLETVGISEDEKRGVLELLAAGSDIDPVVTYLVAATNGLMYRQLIGALPAYPIPEIPIPPGSGALLDVGCSWGRWTIAAQRRGYTAIGIDPSLGAVMAARRVARQLDVAARFVVGDARFLPFPSGQFDRVFSYSVIQHFSRADASAAVAEIGRVLSAGGRSDVQMPTRYGVRCLYHQLRRGFSEGTAFDVRYWSLSELRDLFGSRIGRTTLDVDCYFGIGLQESDAALMGGPRRAVLRASSLLKGAQRSMPFLIHAADSVYVKSTKAVPA